MNTEQEKVNEIIEDLKKHLTLDGRKRVFEDGKPLQSEDLIQPSNPESFTCEELIEKIFQVLELNKRGERHFKTPKGPPRRVDYQVYNKDKVGFLIEAKLLNADLYKGEGAAVPQIKGIFTLYEAKENYAGGVATDGLKWILVDKNSNIIRELDITKEFKELRKYLVGEEKFVSQKTEEEVSKKFYIWYKALLRSGKYKDHKGKTREISKSDCFVENILNVPDEVDREQIAQLTINRLIFIKFLQSKRIIKDDLLLYLTKQSDDVLSSKLKDLFFSVMNTEIKKRIDIPDEFKNVPYLNGSLFDRAEVEKKYDYKIKANILRGTIEFLDSFKFINSEKEEESQSLDPEILGYIFERAMNDTERRGTGSYYTPKHITKYIAENTVYPWILKETNNYLKSIGYKDAELLKEINDLFTKVNASSLDYVYNKILLNVKICDNACGSGAFLLAAANVLQELHHKIREFMGDRSKDKNWVNVWIKKNIIKDNLYGVDINPNAVEIAKLRLWLWLADSFDPDGKIEALPNIDYNILCGNSLFGYIDISDFNKKRDVKDFVMSKLSEIDETLFSTLSAIGKLIEQYKNASGPTAKELKDKINKLKMPANEFLNSNLFVENSKKYATRKEKKIFEKIDELEPLHPFHYGLEFYNVFDPNKDKSRRGFDIIIGNPPYIKEYENKHAFDGLRGSPYYQGKMDIWYFFSCRSIDLLKEGGRNGFIAQNNWITSAGASILRNKLLSDTEIKVFFNFNDFKVFSDAGIQTMIYIAEKKQPAESYFLNYYKITNSKINVDELRICLATGRIFSGIESFKVQIIPFELKNKTITFTKSHFGNILKSVEKAANYFLKEKDVSTGIDVHQDFINDKHLRTLQDKSVRIGDGIFNLSQEEFEGLKLTEKEKEIIKPFYTTEQLHRYYANPKNSLWVIYSDIEVRKNINNYPHIKTHLDKFARVITSDSAPYGLHRARGQKFFEGEKIISLRKTAKPCFTYTDFPCYVSQTYFVIKPEDINLKYLTAVLNSKLVYFWLNNKGKKLGEQLQVDKEPLCKIPLLKPNEKQQAELAKLADKMIDLNKAKDKDNKKIASIAAEIDEKVYALYGLTGEEIKVVNDGL